MAQVTEIIQCGRNNPFVVYSRYGVAIKRASPYISSPGMELFPRGSPVSTQNTQYTRRVQMIDRNDSQNGRICSPSVGITGVRFDPLVCVEDLSNFRGRVTRIYASHRTSFVQIMACLFGAPPVSDVGVVPTGPVVTTLIARFMGPTWGPSGADRTQVGPMLGPWNFLSGRLQWNLNRNTPILYNRIFFKYPL